MAAAHLPAVLPQSLPRRRRLGRLQAAVNAPLAEAGHVESAAAPFLLRAALVADSEAGRYAPHPKSGALQRCANLRAPSQDAGCVLADSSGAVVAEAFQARSSPSHLFVSPLAQAGQGGAHAEVQAAALAGRAADGGTGEPASVAIPRCRPPDSLQPT